MADTTRATAKADENPINSLDGKARTWLQKMQALLDGQRTPGTGHPADNKPDVLGFQERPYPSGLPTPAPPKAVDLLTGAIKAKDVHRVAQYVSLLIVSGQLLGGADSNGDYPLILAVQTNDHIITSLVVQTNKNITSAAGETPLIIAAQLGNLKIVEMLLKNRADVTRQDLKSKTALDYALQKQKADPSNKEFAQILALLQKELQLLSQPKRRPKVPPKSPSGKPKPQKP